MDEKDRMNTADILFSAIEAVYSGIHYYSEYYKKDKGIVKGLRMVYNKLSEQLECHFGLIVFEPEVGDVFDEQEHEAVSIKNKMFPNASLIVKSLVLPGLKDKTGKVVRPAKVVVAAISRQDRIQN